MASRTKETETKRANKKKASGKVRKTKDRNKGTTPKFAIHAK